MGCKHFFQRKGIGAIEGQADSPEDSRASVSYSQQTDIH